MSWCRVLCPPPRCRLLKVKPEERLTTEGVLDHPWLNSTEALDNILPSAQLMMDKVCAAWDARGGASPFLPEATGGIQCPG